MMRLVGLFLKIPFYLWFVLAGFMSWMNYDEWEKTVYQGLESQLSAKKSELIEKQNEVKKIKDFERTREEKLLELQALGAKFESTQEFLPRSADIPTLLKALADVSDKAGIEFSRFAPKPSKKTNILVETPIEVVLKGTYLQIMAFLDASSNLARVVAASTLSIGNPQPRGAVRVVEARASLVTYHIGPDTVQAEGAVGGTPGVPPASSSSAAPVDEMMGTQQ